MQRITFNSSVPIWSVVGGSIHSQGDNWMMFSFLCALNYINNVISATSSPSSNWWWSPDTVARHIRPAQYKIVFLARGKTFTVETSRTGHTFNVTSQVIHAPRLLHFMLFSCALLNWRLSRRLGTWIDYLTECIARSISRTTLKFQCQSVPWTNGRMIGCTTNCGTRDNCSKIRGLRCKWHVPGRGSNLLDSPRHR